MKYICWEIERCIRPGVDNKNGHKKSSPAKAASVEGGISSTNKKTIIIYNQISAMCIPKQSADLDHLHSACIVITIEVLLQQ